MLSAFSYTCLKNGQYQDINNKELFLKSVRGELTETRPFPGFDGMSNAQSAYLCGEMVFLEEVNGDENANNSALRILRPHIQSFEHVLSSLATTKINISTFENRKKCVDNINNYLLKTYNSSIEGTYTRNAVIKTKFELNDTELREVYERNLLDYRLYNYVLSHEILTGRPVNAQIQYA